ncbi:MAG: polyribonucleotide nucleotidyltransferase [Candidatus Dasytiphilus stammeri]
MLNPIIHTFKYGQHTVSFETGMIARQATSSVITRMDDTVVLVTVVVNKKKVSLHNFFPLTVTYQERSYAAGRIPGSFFRREGRASENEILIARLIDRPIRPLLIELEEFYSSYDIQIIATVISIDPRIHPDIVALIGTSAALSISGLPFKGPIGAARVGYIGNKYILNPTIEELKYSNLDLIVAGTKTAVLMVEAEAKVINEDQILDAIIYGHEQQQIVIHNINALVEQVDQKPVYYWIPNAINSFINTELYTKIALLSEDKFSNAYRIIDKLRRYAELDVIKSDVLAIVQTENPGVDENLINNFLYKIQKQLVRNLLLKKNIRIDGRDQDTIRKIDVQTGVLPRVHGSSLFTRGETQALVTVTLGTDRDAQNLDELTGDRTDSFIFHYNFPPYSIGEIAMIGPPKRREIGHGRLAKRGILAVMPSHDIFPYTVRIVSEITESNGSSSMASVCGASLALMDAGVPIKAAVAGIAMGLVKEGNNFIVLSDIIGDEDHFGDMDLKVAGTNEGITALQMDIKIEGITSDILKFAFHQAKKARLNILNIMEKAISLPRLDISKYAPRIHIIKIHPDKIKDVIGKGGSVIRSVTEETGTIIEIDDDGTIKIASVDSTKAELALHRIKEITADIEIGCFYSGKVSRIVDFGAFITILIGKNKWSKEGLIHISQISEKRVEKVTDYLKIGQIVTVKVLNIDNQGRIRLTMKGLIKS